MTRPDRSFLSGPTGAWGCRVVGAAVSTLLPATTTLAQSDIERFQRQLEQIRRDTRIQVDPRVPPGQRLFYDYGLYITPSYLSADDSAGNTRGLRQLDTVGYARLNVDGVHDLFLRGRATYRDFNEGDSFDADGRDEYWKTRVERAQYRFSLARYLSAYDGQTPDNDLTFTAGRQLALWANGLVLNQDVDGAQVDFNIGRAVSVSILAGQTAPYTIDFDASRPNFDDDTQRLFVGAMLSTQVGRHRPFVYYLLQKDQNNADPTVIPTGGGDDIVTDYHYDSQYIGFGSSGSLSDRWLYGIEGVIQTGSSLSRAFVNDPGFSAVDQTTDDIQAYAMDARLDYLFDTPNQTRFSAELILASGDDDRLSTSNTVNGNTPGTTDRAFNAFGLLNTGVAFSAPVSNLILTRVGVSTFPFPDTRPFRKLEIGIDVFTYNKLNADAPVDEATSDSRYLGFEPDLFINWQVTTDVSFALRYGVFFPGDGLTDVDGAVDSPRHFLYTGVTFAF